MCLCHVSPRCCCSGAEGKGHGGRLPHPWPVNSEREGGGQGSIALACAENRNSRVKFNRSCVDVSLKTKMNC